MKKSFISTRLLTEIALVSAIAFVLDVFQSGLFRGMFPNGGSIGIAMLPILIITFRRGFLTGLIASFVLSFLQMLGGVYAIASSWYLVLLQIMLDYIISYPLVSFAGVFYKKFHQSENKKKQINYLIIGTTLGGILKLLSHYLAGVIFWSSSCPENFIGGPYLFSLVYNGGYMIPNIILNAILLVAVYLKNPKLFNLSTENKEELVNE